MLLSSFLLLWIVVYLEVWVVGGVEGMRHPNVENGRPKVAVCVQGQVVRWLPHLVAQGLLHSNPNFDFVFFVNLQYQTSSAPPVFSSAPYLTFPPANITKLSFEAAFQYVTEAWTTNHSRIAHFTFHSMKPKEYFENYFGKSPLQSPMKHYSDSQHVVLNMYTHQEYCIQQLRAYERDVWHAPMEDPNCDIIQQSYSTQQSPHHRCNASTTALPGQHFDYVLSLREDIYFFKPLNLQKLITNHLLNPWSSVLRSTPRTGGQPGCHLAAKECLRWNGVNMRSQFLRRDDALLFLGGRLRFYRHSLEHNIVSLNPESFELAQLRFLNRTACHITVDDFPVTAARQLRDDTTCFIGVEIFKRCIPRGMEDDIWARYCDELLKKEQATSAASPERGQEPSVTQRV